MSRQPKTPLSFWMLILWALIMAALVSAQVLAAAPARSTPKVGNLLSSKLDAELTPPVGTPPLRGDPSADARFCGGKTMRSPATVRAFKKEWPCVAPCDKTWQVDHIIPLAVGGCDSVINMQWLPGIIKTCAGTTCKDRWERRIYWREGAANGR